MRGNAVQWVDAHRLGGLALFWRALLVAPAILLLIAVVMLYEILEWCGR